MNKLMLVVMMAVIAIFALESCKKDKFSAIVNPPAPPDNPPNITSVYGEYPVPNINVAGGLIGAAHVMATNGTSTVETNVGFGGFLKEGNREQLVYGGEFRIDTTVIDTIHIGRGVVYALPNQHKPLSSPHLIWNGASLATFNVGGYPNNHVELVTDTMTLPLMAKVTSPAAGSDVSLGGSVTVSWNGATMGDSVLVAVSDRRGRTAVQFVAAEAGSYTFTADRIAQFEVGSGVVTLAKYRYHIIRHPGGKDYAVLAQTVNTMLCRWK